jgi:hypothetical protein
MRLIFLFLSVVSCIFLSAFLWGLGKAYAQNKPAAEIVDPCSISNPFVLLSVLDRPTFSDSACSVPTGHAVLELGFMDADVRGDGGGAADDFR